MRDDNSEVRVLASEQWGPIGNPAALGMLREALTDRDPYVRIAAAGSLYSLKDRQGVRVLESMVAKEPAAASAADPLAQMRAIAANKVRVVALRQLGRIGREESEAIAKRALRDSNGQVRDAAATMLARFGDERRLNRFVMALESSDAGVRLQAVRALEDVATPATVRFLKPLVKDEAPSVRAAVMSALGAVGGKGVRLSIEKGLEDENALVRSKALAAIGRLGLPETKATLLKILEKPESPFMELLAVAGLARLGAQVDAVVARRALRQSDADVRLLAVEVLEARGGPGDIASLKTALGDGAPRVRVRAAAALVRLLQRKDDK
jgi:HEAT repeat protein